METEIGCGVAEHDMSCLCDVVIPHDIVPITRNGVHDMWMGRELCELRGYGVPWTNQTILDYLVDLESFYDTYHYSKHSLSGESLYDMEPIEFKHEDSPFVKWSQVREVIQYGMDKFNDSLATLMEYYELEPQFLMDCLTTGKAGGDWDDAKVNELDMLFMADNLSYTDIAKQLNISVSTVNGLRKYWRVRRERLKGGDKPAQKMLHKLAKETNLSSRDIVEMVHRDFGKLYNISVVNKVRSRHRQGQ